MGDSATPTRYLLGTRRVTVTSSVRESTRVAKRKPSTRVGLTRVRIGPTGSDAMIDAAHANSRRRERLKLNLKTGFMYHVMIVDLTYLQITPTTPSNRSIYTLERQSNGIRQTPGPSAAKAVYPLSYTRDDRRAGRHDTRDTGGGAARAGPPVVCSPPQIHNTRGRSQCHDRAMAIGVRRRPHIHPA